MRGSFQTNFASINPLCQKENFLFKTFERGYWRQFWQLRNIRKCGNSWKKKKNCIILLFTNHNKAIISNDLRIMDATFAHNWWTRIKFFFLYSKNLPMLLDLTGVFTFPCTRSTLQCYFSAFLTSGKCSFLDGIALFYKALSLKWEHCRQIHLTVS